MKGWERCVASVDRVWTAVRIWIAPLLAVTYPPASDNVGALKSALPIVGTAWPYSVTGILASIIVGADTRFRSSLTRKVGGRGVATIRWVLPILAAATLILYHVLWIATAENAATWVYWVFPWLYCFVVLFVSLSVSWLIRR